MRFHTSPDAPAVHHDLIFRPSRIVGVIELVMALFLLSLSIPIFIGGAGGWSDLFGCCCWLAVIAPFVIVFLHSSVRAFSGEGWLVRYDGRRLLIKFRSHLNAALPRGDEVVVELTVPEIVSIGKTTERRFTPTTRKSSVGGKEKIVYLDVTLHEPAKELEARLHAERQRYIETWTGSHINLHYPVRVVDDRIIRIEWRSSTTWMSPGINRILASLGETVPVRPPRLMISDMVTPGTDQAAKETQIIALIEQGRMLDAIRVVRSLYGLSLGEAKQFVEELNGR